MVGPLAVELMSLPLGVRSTVRGAPVTGCLLWVGTRNGQGFPQMWDGQRNVSVHRLVWAHVVGQIPKGFRIRHRCRQAGCVRPSHLEAVENEHRAITHCPSGHEYDEANTYVDRSGARHCRACARRRAGDRRAAARASA